MTWPVYIDAWVAMTALGCLGGLALVLLASRRRIGELSEKLWFIGTLPSAFAAVTIAAEPLIGREVVRMLIASPLALGSVVAFALFAMAIAGREVPPSRLAWAIVRATQIACWLGGCLLSCARVLDV